MLCSARKLASRPGDCSGTGHDRAGQVAASRSSGRRRAPAPAPVPRLRRPPACSGRTSVTSRSGMGHGRPGRPRLGAVGRGEPGGTARLRVRTGTACRRRWPIPAFALSPSYASPVADRWDCWIMGHAAGRPFGWTSAAKPPAPRLEGFVTLAAIATVGVFVPAPLIPPAQHHRLSQHDGRQPGRVDLHVPQEILVHVQILRRPRGRRRRPRVWDRFAVFRQALEVKPQHLFMFATTASTVLPTAAQPGTSGQRACSRWRFSQCRSNRSPALPPSLRNHSSRPACRRMLCSVFLSSSAFICPGTVTRPRLAGCSVLAVASIRLDPTPPSASMH